MLEWIDATYLGLIPFIENFVNQLKGDKEVGPLNWFQLFVTRNAALVATAIGIGLVTLLSGGDYVLGITFGLVVGGGSSLFYEYKQRNEVVVVEDTTTGEGELQ